MYSIYTYMYMYMCMYITLITGDLTHTHARTRG